VRSQLILLLIWIAVAIAPSTLQAPLNETTEWLCLGHVAASATAAAATATAATAAVDGSSCLFWVPAGCCCLLLLLLLLLLLSLLCCCSNTFSLVISFDLSWRPGKFSSRCRLIVVFLFVSLLLLSFF
jgi:hypothetical protein